MPDTQPSSALPQMSGRPVVTDGGLETDLIYHHGVELPHFAAFPLVDDDRGREPAARLLRRLRRHRQTGRRRPATRDADVAGEQRLGRPARVLARRARPREPGCGAAARPSSVTARASTRCSISGCLGPRGDGYVAGETVDPDEAAAYHAPQIEAFADAGADLITVLTLTGTGEAIGIVRAARAAALPVAVSFTVEQDGRLPDGTSLAAAIAEVDAEGGARLLHGELRAPHPHRGRARPSRAMALDGSPGSVPTRRPSATPSSTRQPSWTRATPPTSLRPSDSSTRRCRTSR